MKSQQFLDESCNARKQTVGVYYRENLTPTRLLDSYVELHITNRKKQIQEIETSFE